MSDLKLKRILVVGATGVFGSLFCQQLSELGASLVATASGPESAHRLPSGSSKSYFLDLADPQQIERLVSDLEADPAGLDAIILASGVVAFGSAAETPASVVEQMLRVNFLGQVQLVSRLLPLLSESAEQNREPFVVSISGVIAENPMANMAAYSASKTAMHGYAVAATRELRRAGIRWIDARPGHTESGLASRAIFGQAPAFGAGLEPDAVVRRIIDAIVNDEKDLPSASFSVATA